MPLREADLNSLDACKRALRQDAQAIRMGAALRFWLYQKVGVGVGVDKETFPLFPVLVDNRGVRDAMAKNNSAVLCHGICRMTKDGRCLVFETESQEMNANVAGVLKKAVAALMSAQEVVIRVAPGAQRQGSG
jgi:hypothetical protein